MKKLLILALLSIAFNAMADDYFLYWMVDDGAKIYSIGKTSSKDLSDYDTLYAKIRQVDTSSGTAVESYLNLYASPDSAYSYGTVREFEPDFFKATFARVASASSPGSGSTLSYYIELYNDSGSGTPGTWIGRQLLEWDSSMVTAGGMSVPPEKWAAIGEFTAAPEPTSGLLMLVGLAGLALRRKNKRA